MAQTNQKFSRHLPAILIPLLAGTLYLILALIKLPNSLYYGLPSSAPVILPITITAIFIVLLFHLLKHFFNLKIATLADFAIALALGLISLLSAPDGHLADILESIYLSDDKSATVVITDPDLYQESKSYPSPTTPLLSAYPDDLDSFWLISPLPETHPSSPLEDYEITDEISTPYHLAIKLEKKGASNVEM